MNRKMNIGLGQCTPTSCPKAGIKIHETYNTNTNNTNTNIYKQTTNDIVNKKSQLDKPVDFHNTTLDCLDLDLEHYSLEDLYHLFNIENGVLTEPVLKNAKQIVLKMHPDKSKLDAKYFLFFSKAYKRLYSIYDFQNKSTNKVYKDQDFFDDSNRVVLDTMFEKNKNFKDPKNFNSWFNETFEKHRLENPTEHGYGNWLKSDEGIMDIQDNVTKGNMNEIFEQKKKQIQALTVYQGVTDMFAPTLGGTLLNDESNFSSDNYTDLRQAYTETLIPVTLEDYERMPKYNSFNEYKSKRDSVDTTPLTKLEAERMLYSKETEMEQQSAALAFKYAKEAELAKQKQKGFWGDIKQITGW